MSDEYTPQAAIDRNACPHCGGDSYYCEHSAELWGTPAHLWPCGCLRNNAGAHRVGCPDHPDGIPGEEG